MRFSHQRVRRATFALCLFAAASLAATPPDYFKEPAIVQEFSKDLSFQADGTWRCDQTAVIRFQSDAGLRQYGVLDFGYKSSNESVEVVYVRVRKPDGTVTPTPAENVQDVSSEITRIAPTYSDLREKQIPVRALSVGDTLEYKVTFLANKPEIPGQFWYSQDFLSGLVALKETLRISVPADKYLKVASPTVKPEVREEGGRKIYTWITSQLDPTPQEVDKKKPAPKPAPPAVELTTFKSWDEVGRWYAQLQADRVVVTPAIQAKADELTKGLTSDADRQRAIYNYVSTKFRYISVSFGMGRYQPHSAADVLPNGYGDCKDKHTLFTSLLKAVGMEAWPALMGAGIELDAAIPSPSQFNHVITVLPNGKEYVWLDTTPEMAPYRLIEPELRDKQALVIPSNSPATLMTTPPDPAVPNSEFVQAKATLDSSGTLKAHFDLTTRGDEEVIFRTLFHQLAPAQWQQVVQAMVNGLGFAGTVSSVDVDNPENLDKPFHFSYEYLRNDYSDWPNRRITPPLFPFVLPSPRATTSHRSPSRQVGRASSTTMPPSRFPRISPPRSPTTRIVPPILPNTIVSIR